MKAARHAMILDLIETFNIETQDDLAMRLKDRGINVTQATVSRDIKELRLIKVLADDGGYKYATVDKAEAGMKERFVRIFSNSVISITSAANLIIIKTISGTGSAAGEAIDSLRWSEVAGTLAGDNTVFVAIKDVKSVPELVKRFNAMLKQ
ncbi:MAG: arginine repressor [Clostridia bacterium]|nr:arginine repressor [Clostridia bacterium]